MFSHALVAYQLSLMEFFTKTSETFTNTLAILSKEPHYSFTILKELTQTNGEEEVTEQNAIIEHKTVDSDQMLFFKVSLLFSNLLFQQQQQKTKNETINFFRMSTKIMNLLVKNPAQKTLTKWFRMNHLFRI